MVVAARRMPSNRIPLYIMFGILSNLDIIAYTLHVLVLAPFGDISAVLQRFNPTRDSISTLLNEESASNYNVPVADKKSSRISIGRLIKEGMQASDHIGRLCTPAFDSKLEGQHDHTHTVHSWEGISGLLRLRMLRYLWFTS